MKNGESQLVLVSIDKLQSLLNPVLNRLVVIEENLKKKSITQKSDYYRNKDLKARFGLSANTIIKYRDTGVIPYTIIGEVYLYPINQLEEMLRINSNLDLFFKKAS